MRGFLRVPAAIVLATLSSCGFTESSSRYSTHERQIEARTEGELDLRYAWLDDATLVAVAPLHAAGGRTEFSRARLDALTHADGPRLWLALTLWDFRPPPAVGTGTPAHDPPEPPALALGRDGIPVSASTSEPAGKVAALPPSKLLAAVTEPEAKPLLATITGAGSLPPLRGGQSLQLVVVLPTGASLAELATVEVALPRQTLALGKVTVSALLWDEFRSQPSKARFDALVAAQKEGEVDPADHGSGK